MDKEILVVAGEASGDTHAAGLIRQVNARHADCHLKWYGSGGHCMAAEGVRLIGDIAELGAIGPGAALANLGRYWKLYRRILRETAVNRPQLAVLVDFPEFNLRLARRLKARGIPVCYFISPQIWAWRSGRVRQVKRSVDLMLVLFPFEQEYYARHGIRAAFVGHPTAHELSATRRQPPKRTPSQVKIVALVPGSRVSEVERIFPIQLDAARYLAARSRVRFVVPVAPSIQAERLRLILDRWGGKNGNLDLRFEQSPLEEVLPTADFAVVKSGTSTLQAMLLGVPFAMVYRLSPLSWLFGRLLVDTDTYCLANIVSGRRLVREFVQREADPAAIGQHVLEFLNDDERRESLRRDLLQAADCLGSADAYEEASLRMSPFILTDREAA